MPRCAKLILDRVEGLGHGYREEQVFVSIGDKEILATIYCAISVDPALKPYTWYKALVVAGAKEHGLPPQYIAALEVTDAIIDADTCRHQKNMALVSSS